MKRFALCFLMMFICLSGVSGKNCYALVVGISNYGDESLNLSSPKDDAKRLYDVLGKDPLYVRSIIQNQHAKKETVLSELTKIIRAARSEDCIVFFFAGHGEDGYLLMADKMELSYSELISLFKKAKAQHVYCFIDACHSGSIKKQFAKRNTMLQLSGVNFVMACRDNQLAAESNWIGHGYFSQALNKGMNGDADKDENGQITLLELYNYIKSDVAKRAKSENVDQTPQLIASKKSLNSVIIHQKKKK